MTELPDAFWQGVEQFNQREFYACHDTLEALWMEAVEPDKKFYQGILQVAVALYHLSNQNWRGAVILLGEGTNRLRGYQPTYAEIDVEQFRADAFHLLTTLQQTGPEAVAMVMQQLGLTQTPEVALPDASEAAIAPSDSSSQPLLTIPTLRKVAP